MKKLFFKKIDAFATVQSSGNPAGCIYLNNLKDLTETEMLQIAKELKGFVNEVGYIAQVDKREFDLRYYSSDREVDFCGHATIAIMYDLIKTNKSLIDIPTFEINTQKDQLLVENRIKSENSVFIMAPELRISQSIPDTKELIKYLKIDSNIIDSNYPISVFNAGLETLIVPIKDLDSILGIQPNLNTLKEFCISNSIDIIEVFTSDVSDNSNDYRTRVFAPTFGYLEDPATGSGNSAFGYYLINNDLWNEKAIIIEQNGFRTNFNIVRLQKRTDDKDEQRVYFGGGAITRVEGKYFLY